MCGLAGFLDTRARLDPAAWPALLNRMGNAIRHRGPDGTDIWVDTRHGLGLVHRRLAIIDLSPAGHQPMTSASGRWVIGFNGEIYNHMAMRRQLEESGVVSPDAWRGHSDTETLIEAVEAWGPEKALQATVGMFALAAWDTVTGRLTLARDRLGEKPLYYGLHDGVLIFGSELKALRAHPMFSGRLDRGALSLYLRHSCVPAPYSIYEGVYKLPPGCRLQIDAEQLQSARLPEPIAYWSMHDVVARGQSSRFDGDDAAAVDALEHRLREAVALQMVADVPLGAFLSGGVDSSTIVALMQTQSERPVRTFTIGFHEPGYNEAEHALAVARHLGTEHTELYVTAQQAQNVIPSLPDIYDEPFADVSQIPTFLVARLARQQVTVSLSGDAGDELFGGYNRYLMARSGWKRLQNLPPTTRRMIAWMIGSMPASAWNALFAAARPMLPVRTRIPQPADKIQKLLDLLAATSPQDLYRRLVSHTQRPETLVIGGVEPPTLLSEPACWRDAPDLEHWMMAADTQTYLPDDVLTKVDRAAMAVSLETRVPMLDHRVVELAWQMPLHLKIRRGQSKWVLRQLLYRHVPPTLIERPKMGFTVPIEAWLRGPLRSWAAALIEPNRLRREGILDPAPIDRMWRQHQSGAKNWQHQLWDILMFQAWMERDSRP